MSTVQPSTEKKNDTGFYDRLLAGAAGIKCGVCYDGQLFPEIPAEPHDAKVDFILTPSKLVRRKA